MKVLKTTILKSQSFLKALTFLNFNKIKFIDF